MVNVKADIRVQYMFKDVRTDMPVMCEPTSHAVEVTVPCPPDLVKYLTTYVANAVHASRQEEQESYTADRESVKKWKARLKRKYPDEFAGKLTDDDVIEGAVSCSIEDAIKDTVEERWDGEIGPGLGAVPAVPDGKRLGGRFIHLNSWTMAGQDA